MDESMKASRARPGGRPLQLLPKAEFTQVTVEFNDTAADYPAHQLIHGLFEEQVVRTPTAIAVSGNGQLTYEELNSRANQLGRHLSRQGLGPDSTVALCIERGADMLVALLGILKAGAAYVPLDPAYPAARLEYILSNSKPRVVLTQEMLKAKVPATTATIISLDTDWPVIETYSTANLKDVEVKAENLAYLIYTSGSTGQPKGVAIEHRNAVNLIWWARSTLPAEAFARTLQSTSLNFDLSVYECFVPLAVGGCVHVVENAIALAKEALPVTLINTVPSAMSALIDSKSIPRTTRVINLAGEVLKQDLVDRIFEQTDVQSVFNLYGPSETTTYSTCIEMKRATGFVPSIGRPIANTQIYILDKRRQPVPIGVVGEIYIGGAGVARNYFNRPDLTDERFLSDAIGSNGTARLYRTGDLGRWRRDGSIEYVGRDDHQVKIRGFRIELGEIQARLAQVDGVKEAAVIAREDSGEKRLVAYVVSAADNGIQVDEMRTHLASSLPAYMVPSAFVKLDRLPLTPNGKLDRAALPAPESGDFAHREYEPPRGATEQALVRIWGELLPTERIGRHDNFFEVGGHSLHGMKLIAAIADRFAVSLSVITLFQNPTIQKMSQAIESLQKQGRPANHCPSERVAPLTFSQRQHFNLYRLSRRPAIRQIASVTRLRGMLDVDVLMRSAEEIARWHEALRTRIVMIDEIPAQKIENAVSCALSLEDISSLSEAARVARLADAIDEIVMTPVDLATGPLVGLTLLRLRPDEHILLVAMEHMIADMVSMGIFLRDLLIVYEHKLTGTAFERPGVGVTLADYARWQQASQKQWVEAHSPYWENHLLTQGRLRFPESGSELSGNESGWASVPVRIDHTKKKALERWAKGARSTLVMCVFTAYVAVVLRWCHASEGVFIYQTDGRLTADVGNTIGYFAFPLYLRIESRPTDGFADLLRRVEREYCRAYEHADLSFYESQTPRPEISKNTCFNWIPQMNYPAAPDAPRTEGAIALESVPFRHPMIGNLERDGEPFIQLQELTDQVLGDVYFPRNRFSVEVIERFCREFSDMLDAAIEGSFCTKTQAIHL